MPPQGRGAADAAGAGARQAVDRPGRQGAAAGTRVPAEDRRRPAAGQRQPVRAVAVSPDKSTVAAGRGNQIHLYDAGSGTYIRILIAPGLKTADGKDVKAAHLSLVESLACSPDGKYLVSGSFQEITIWDAHTGQLRHKITGFAHNVVALAFSADGKLLATGGGAPTEDGEVKVFEVGTWKLITDIKNGHSDTVYGLCFSPDGKKLASCSADKFVKVLEVPSGKFVKSFEGHTHHVLDVGWTSDGKLLASAGADNTVKVWDFEKGEQVRTINAHAKQVTRLLFIGKKAEFLTCGGDNQVRGVQRRQRRQRRQLRAAAPTSSTRSAPAPTARSSRPAARKAWSASTAAPGQPKDAAAARRRKPKKK